MTCVNETFLPFGTNPHPGMSTARSKSVRGTQGDRLGEGIFPNRCREPSAYTRVRPPKRQNGAFSGDVLGDATLLSSFHGTGLADLERGIIVVWAACNSGVGCLK